MTHKNYNILYVDDEKTNLNAFNLAYWRKFNVSLAESGQKGLEILKSKHIDVIISDQRMPNMTGIDFLKKVKLKWPNLKYILLTGYTDHEAMKEAVNDVSIYWYMNKPFDTYQMELVILNAIEASQSEHLLKESEEKFRGVFNSMVDVFTRTDMEGICLMISPSVFEAIGYKDEEIIGKKLSDFYVNPERREYIIQKLKEGDVQTFESRVITKDGDIITISSNAKMIFDEMGKPKFIESVFRNITKRKKVEIQILEYQLQLKALASELILTEEKLRKQIAIDLHDDVGQLLASSRLQLAALNNKFDKTEILEKCKDISIGLLNAIKAVRSAIFDLSPPQLNEIGLFAAVSDWLEEQIEPKYKISTKMTGDDYIFSLEEDVRVLLFRSIRELLMNIVKHAKATKVVVNIKTIKRTTIEITIKDNGVGFDTDQSKSGYKAFGFGLFSIKERMENIEGSMNIDSIPGKGTEIKLIAPIKELQPSL